MKIDYISDVHINHYVKFKHHQGKWEVATRQWAKKLLNSKQGNILILAGDFSEWNIQSYWFIDECSQYYERVYVTYGNHDYYIISKNQLKKYKNSVNRVLELTEMLSSIKNVVVLDGVIDVYENKVFAGHPLWYQLKDTTDYWWYNKHSNDSVCIYYKKNQKESHELLYEEAMDFYEKLEDAKIDVFVSHVPPINPPFVQHTYNACYVAPVPFLIGKHWVCGHQHTQGEFRILDTHFHMNPLGYPIERNELKLKTFRI